MRWISIAFLIGSGGMLVGCASIMSSVTGDLADGISEAVANSADLETVRDGAPAYLILLDGLIAQNPKDAGLLMSAAALNSVYAGAFVAEPEREVLMTDKAFDYAQRGACLKITDSCVARTQPFDEFTAWVADLNDRDVDIAYQLGRAWGFWILAHVDDWGAIAELGRPKVLMSRVVQLDEGHAGGGAYLALGLMESFLPAAVGGHPELGREHFERAIQLSHGRDLIMKVMFAQLYARLVFDRELHDRLLVEVVEAEPIVDGLTLSNVIAQQQASELLITADEYF